MSKFSVNHFFLSIGLLLISTISQANSLTQSDIDDYVKSFELLKSSNNPVVKNLEESMKDGEGFKLDTDKDGNIAIVSQVINSLTGEQKKVLGEIADNAGFSSLEDWAGTADKIAAAMMAFEMSKEEVDVDMSQLTPEMLEMVPPQMREQMEGAIRLMNALKNVPEQDIKLVKANYEKLIRLMEE